MRLLGYPGSLEFPVEALVRLLGYPVSLKFPVKALVRLLENTGSLESPVFIHLSYFHMGCFNQSVSKNYTTFSKMLFLFFIFIASPRNKPF